MDFNYIYNMLENNNIQIHVEDSNLVWSELKGKPDSVLMRIITGAKLDMEASCDGECACSTCHVYVDPEWLGLLDPPSEEEQMMIEYTEKPKANSRLSCQIKLKPQLNGMRLKIAGK